MSSKLLNTLLFPALIVYIKINELQTLPPKYIYSYTPAGTVSVNGVPLLTSNMTAVNGVVHLSADVIPESDLGSDPTSLPNPLLDQTEVSVFSNFGFGDFIPNVPVISGLYDLPDHDPFRDFIEKPTTISIPERNTESPPPELQGFLGSVEGLPNVHSNVNNLQTRPRPQWPVNNPPDQSLFGFLGLLENTFETSDVTDPVTTGATHTFPPATPKTSEGTPNFLVVYESGPTHEESPRNDIPVPESGVLPPYFNFPGGDPGVTRSPPSVPVPVVPESTVGCSLEDTAKVEKRSQLSVLTLLERLNLTRFLELVKHAGLTLTLKLDGESFKLYIRDYMGKHILKR